MKKTQAFYVVFLIYDLDDDLCDQLGVDADDDSSVWTQSQYKTACELLEIPNASTPITLDLPSQDFDNEDALLDWATEKITDIYGWFVDSITAGLVTRSQSK